MRKRGTDTQKSKKQKAKKKPKKNTHTHTKSQGRDGFRFGAWLCSSTLLVSFFALTARA
jgi:hypothetical protein